MLDNEPIAVFDRLAGLETEYAIHYRPFPGTKQPPRLRLFQQLLSVLRRRIPTAEATHDKEGVFLATGGAVWFEAEQLTPRHGRIEGSTPECRGPRQLLICQRAQDRLLAESAQAAPVSGELRLLKSDRDAEGSAFGSQENYEARIASGWSLRLWQLGLALLTPAMAVSWLSAPLIVVALIAYLALAGIAYLPLSFILRRPPWLAVTLFGEDLVRGQCVGAPLPIWLEASVRRFRAAMSAPLAAGLWLLCRCFAFREQRGQLTPFLVSRAIFAARERSTNKAGCCSPTRRRRSTAKWGSADSSKIGPSLCSATC